MQSKKTMYFVSQQFNITNQIDAFNSVLTLRNAFLEKESEIDEIESEHLDFYPIERNASLFAVISLTYFTKQLE